MGEIRPCLLCDILHWWTDDMGVTHEIWQGEGGEQGDPFMPALYACGQHRAFVHVSEDLLDGRHLREPVSGPRNQARIRLHQGKTQLWNRGGVAQRVGTGTAAARTSNPSAVVWKGDPSLPVSEQGLRILGTPLGHPEYVHHQLRRTQKCRIFNQRGCCSHIAQARAPSTS